MCNTREPHHMNPGSRVNWTGDVTSGVKDTQTEDGCRDLRDAFKTMGLVPLVLPSTMSLLPWRRRIGGRSKNCVIFAYR